MISTPEDFAKQADDLLHQLSGLFEKYAVKKGDWATLALKLAIAHDEIKLSSEQDKGGRVKNTSVHHIRNWLRVRRKIDDGLNESKACKAGGLSRTQYHETKKDLFVQALERAREEIGEDAFWSMVDQHDWEKEARKLDELPRMLRLILAGQKEPHGEAPTSLLSGNPPKG